MEDAGNPRFVAAHALDVAGRSPAESDALAALFLRYAWPAGHDDRFDPIAVEWLRRWTPNSIDAVRDLCSCVDGRCTVCN